MSSLLVGFDLGTSYFKVGLFAPGGTLRGLGRVRVETQAPAPGRVELPVETFWALLRRGLDEALAQAGASAADIAAISYSSQATTLLLLDDRDQPLTPLVVWTDTRGGPVEPELAAFAAREAFRVAIGHGGFMAESAVPKLRWFMKHEPHLWARATRVMSISDYLTFALTGERAGDASTAAFLGIYHLAERRWWPAALEFIGIEASRLSTPLLPGAACGRTVAAAARLLGVPAGRPFAVGAIDHHAAAIGSGLGRLAEVSLSTGTVLAALSLVAHPTPAAGCYHGPHVDGERFYRLAFDPNGAGQLEEYQRRAAPELSLEQLLELAANVPPGGGAAGDGASGGRGENHGAAVRALLEQVAQRHRALVRLVEGEVAVPRVIATGGGARSPLWLQIYADVLNATVVRPASPERACLGAAAFAAVAAGHYASIAEATAAMVRPDREFEPIAAR
jgi:sugar (pentulose or hexulose) kinase